MTRRRHVLFIQSQEFFGADTMVHSLIMRHLDRRKFRVSVACNPRSPVWQQLNNIPMTRMVPANFGPSVFEKGRLGKLAAAPSAIAGAAGFVRLLIFVLANRVEIIHATEKPRDGLFAVILARLSKARSVIHLHVKYHESLTGRARWALTNADLTVGVSQFVEDTAREQGASHGSVTHVLNALDTEGWETPRDGKEIRKELGIPADALTISIVSRIFAWKGHRDLLAAFARIAPLVPKAVLVIVGEDDPRANPGGGSLTSELRNRAVELGIEDRVIFTGFRSDVRAIMGATDIFAMPSFEEPFGIVFLEAMAAGVPVLALRNGGTVQVVEDGVTGLLADPGDIDQLACHLQRLACSPELRSEYGNAGRCRVKQAFTPERLARDMAQVYENLLERPR